VRAALIARRMRERTPVMTALDAVLLLLLVLFALRGFWRGFLREALGLAGLVLAGVLVVGWSEPIAHLLSSRGGLSPLTARLASAVGLALAVFLVVRFLGGTVARLTSALFLRPIDRVAGIGLGLAEGSALLGLALAAVLRVAPTSALGHVIGTSPVARPLLQVATRIVDAARPLATPGRDSI
jgi:membrane protein required for colicin V production